jgi:predicted alpha/beta hydrolase
MSGDRRAPAPAQAVILTAQDGVKLAALRYPAGAGPRGRIVVASATGVPQGFYRRFAVFAQARGFEVMTLDYRGIGLSAPPSLAGYHVDYLDWARLDLAAAVAAMAGSAGPLFLVGHSYGGHALGLLPNHERIERAVLFATGAGWHGWMPPLERLRVLAMWNLAGPLLTRWKGYLPWSLLGMGEDLPLSVYRQWRQWCRNPRYFFDDPGMLEVHAGFARVRTPILAVNATDDDWAPPRSRDAFMPGYSGADWQGVDIDPRTRGLGPIGHMGYFRPQAQPLWQATLDWLQAPQAAPAPFERLLDRAA